MRSQPFQPVLDAGLLEGVERLVVAEHRAFTEHVLAEPWTPPRAYRWIRYEDPDPVARLAEAAGRLEREWAELGSAATPALLSWQERTPLAPALGLASDLGFA